MCERKLLDPVDDLSGIIIASWKMAQDPVLVIIRDVDCDTAGGNSLRFAFGAEALERIIASAYDDVAVGRKFFSLESNRTLSRPSEMMNTESGMTYSGPFSPSPAMFASSKPNM